MALSKVFSGARARFDIIDIYGRPNTVGYAAGVSGGEDIEYQPVEVLDNLAIQEHVPVSYRTSLNCQIFRTVVGTGQGDGKFGSLRQRGLMPIYEDILTSGTMTATVVDHGAGKGNQFAVYKFTDVRAASTSFDITPRGIVGENVTFVAIKRLDESQT